MCRVYGRLYNEGSGAIDEDDSRRSGGIRIYNSDEVSLVATQVTQRRGLKRRSLREMWGIRNNEVKRSANTISETDETI
jgi:hypothetical protein